MKNKYNLVVGQKVHWEECISPFMPLKGNRPIGKIVPSMRFPEEILVTIYFDANNLFGITIHSLDPEFQKLKAS